MLPCQQRQRTLIVWPPNRRSSLCRTRTQGGAGGTDVSTAALCRRTGGLCLPVRGRLQPVVHLPAMSHHRTALTLGSLKLGVLDEQRLRRGGGSTCCHDSPQQHAERQPAPFACVRCCHHRCHRSLVWLGLKLLAVVVGGGGVWFVCSAPLHLIQTLLPSHQDTHVCVITSVCRCDGGKLLRGMLITYTRALIEHALRPSRPFASTARRVSTA